jgi:hypothetical protein
MIDGHDEMDEILVGGLEVVAGIQTLLFGDPGGEPRIDWTEEPGPPGQGCGCWQMEVKGFWDFFTKLKKKLPHDAKIEKVSRRGSVVRFADKDYAAVMKETKELMHHAKYDPTKNFFIGNNDVKKSPLEFIPMYPDTPRGVHEDDRMRGYHPGVRPGVRPGVH